MLETKDLQVGFPNKKGNVVLIGGLDLSTREGGVTAIIGRNGTGKTTLLRTLAGLHPALKGEIFLGGKLLSGISAYGRAMKMAMVNTTRFGLGYFTVNDLVALGRHPYTGFMGFLDTTDENVIEEVCVATGIIELRQKTINQLSDGEYQKVMIARALAQDTPLLLLDEPTAHLDLINRIEIFRLIKTLAEEKGTTIVVCTHEIEAALSVADQLVMLTEYKKAVVGKPAELVNSGQLESIFTHEGIEFDRTTRRFKY